MSGNLGLVTRLVRQNTRRFTTSKARYITEKEVQKIKEKQATVQAKHEKDPIHIVAGKTHFYVTSALGVIVMGLTGHTIYTLHKLH